MAHKLSELVKDALFHYKYCQPQEKEQIVKTIFFELTFSGKNLLFKTKDGFQLLESRLKSLAIPNCARSGSRTHMSFRSKDFKSFVYTIPPSGHISKYEARVGIEPTYKGFADPCLTTWLPCHLLISYFIFLRFSIGPRVPQPFLP